MKTIGEIPENGRNNRKEKVMEWIDKTAVPYRKTNVKKQDRAEKGMDAEADKDGCFKDKNRQPLYEDFLAIIRELTDTAHKLAQIEEEKAVAVSLKRHELLEGLMKKEEAGMLRLRGLDQHRVRMAKLLGWDNLSFSQILEKVRPIQQEYLKQLFLTLEQELMRLTKSKELAKGIINIRIYEMFIAAERKTGTFYDQEGNVNFDEFSHANLCDRYV